MARPSKRQIALMTRSIYLFISFNRPTCFSEPGKCSETKTKTKPTKIGTWFQVEIIRFRAVIYFPSAGRKANLTANKCQR